MAGRKRHFAEDIVRKLRRADELAAEGKAGEEVAAELQVSVATLYNWRRAYGGMDTGAVKKREPVTSRVRRRRVPSSAAAFGASRRGSDAELDRYLTDLLASITLQIRRILEVYRDRAWIRSDVTFDEVVETAAVLVSVDTYLRITHRDGWSVAAYQSWLRRMLAETVFVAPQKN